MLYEGWQKHQDEPGLALPTLKREEGTAGSRSPRMNKRGSVPLGRPVVSQHMGRRKSQHQPIKSSDLTSANKEKEKELSSLMSTMSRPIQINVLKRI